jgi:two-component system OmpR family sensor kinase
VKSLRARLFAATLAALALTLALTVAIGAVLTRRQVDRSQATALARRADDLALQRRNNPSYVNRAYTSGSVQILVQPRADLRSYVADVSHSSNGKTTVDGKTFLYSYRTLPSRGLLLLRPESLRSSEWRPFLRDLLLAALVGVGFAAALSYFLARSITGPIRRVADATRALAADERHDPLPTEGTNELASLARAFNEMTEQLAAARQAERDFLLSVSHELKTPLTAIRGYAEGLTDGAFGPEEAGRTIALESGRLERLVRDLLDLARMNRSAFAVGSEPVDLAEVAREAVRRHESSARTFDVELAATGEEAWVSADHDRVLQVASNLVENALRETPAGGRVTVASAAAGTLSVADTGPGIPPEDVPHAFERFYLYDKIGKDRPVGSGLGLAIVAQLARAMGGSVRVESSLGQGTTFVVTLEPLSGTQLSGTQLAGVDDFEVGTAQRS